MKILMINGSPHPRGCTYTALHEMERVLRAAGAEVQILTVGAEQMGGCVACGGCRATGRCVRGGLVNDAIDAMETADALVLASPVHYAGISGAMSAFCDRLFYASDGWANKPCACVVSARRAGTTAALDQLVKYPMISNMPVVSSQYWPMVHGACPEDAAQDAEGLQTMRQLARNLLWLARCIAAGDAAGVARPDVLIAFIQYHDKLESNMAKIVSCISLTLVMGTLVYGIVTRVDTEWIYNWKYGKYLDGVFNVIFWISLLVLVLSLFKDKYVKYRLSFILGCIACVSGSLLMVTPIGPRCFFATFVLTIWFIAEVCNLVNINEDIYGILTKMEIAALVIVMGMQFAVYAPIYKADRARLDKVRKAESEGKSEVTIQRLPYEGYLHAPSPSEEIWEYRYKLFYNISQDLKIKVVEHKY